MPQRSDRDVRQDVETLMSHFRAADPWQEKWSGMKRPLSHPPPESKPGEHRIRDEGSKRIKVYDEWRGIKRASSYQDWSGSTDTKLDSTRDPMTPKQRKEYQNSTSALSTSRCGGSRRSVQEVKELYYWLDIPDELFESLDPGDDERALEIFVGNANATPGKAFSTRLLHPSCYPLAKGTDHELIVLTAFDGIGSPVHCLAKAIQFLFQQGIRFKVVRIWIWENNPVALCMSKALEVGLPVEFRDKITHKGDISNMKKDIISLDLQERGPSKILLSGSPCTNASRGARFATRKKGFWNAQW
jgi:hypothetical protein